MKKQALVVLMAFLGSGLFVTSADAISIKPGIPAGAAVLVIIKKDPKTGEVTQRMTTNPDDVAEARRQVKNGEATVSNLDLETKKVLYRAVVADLSEAGDGDATDKIMEYAALAEEVASESVDEVFDTYENATTDLEVTDSFEVLYVVEGEELDAKKLNASPDNGQS